MSSDSTLADRSVLVTGSGSGIGQAIAEAFAAQGASVMLNVSNRVHDRPDGDELRQRHLATAKGIAERYPRSRVVTGDLTDDSEVRQMCEECGPIDILINNAGLQHVSPVEQFSQERWERIMRVMLTAPFMLIKHFLPGMYANKWGRIINMGSVHSLVASPHKAAYVAAKHGLLGLTKCVALEAAPHGVTVNALCPGFVRTSLLDHQIADQARILGISEPAVLDEVILKQHAIKRIITVEEVAQTALFLCRDEAWSITGSALTMDAGWSAH